MFSFSFALFAALSLFQAASTLAASFVTFTPDGWTKAKGFAGINVRWREVPTGTCELDQKVKSYSGYADLANDQHIFFWFFESRKVDPAKAPLTVWLSGGPGSSSLSGLFQENGPCRIDNDLKVQNNPYALSEISNVLYIDQPGLTGLSYTNPVPGYVNTDTTAFTQLPRNACPDYAEKYGTCGTYGYVDPTSTANSTATAAPIFWQALQGFVGAFPKYSRDKINIATTGYGGHYGPLFSQYLDKRNTNLGSGAKAAKRISVNTLVIGSAYIDPVPTFQYVYDFATDNSYDTPLVQSGSQTDRLATVISGPGNCVDRNKKCAKTKRIDVCVEAYTYCVSEITSTLGDIGRVEEDIRYPRGSAYLPTSYIAYLNQATVRHAIGAYVTYFDFSYTVSRQFLATGELSRKAGSVAALRNMVKQGKSVIMYTGDADLLTPWKAIEQVAANIAAPYYNIAGYQSMAINSATSSSTTAEATTAATTLASVIRNKRQASTTSSRTTSRSTTASSRTTSKTSASGTKTTSRTTTKASATTSSRPSSAATSSSLASTPTSPAVPTSTLTLTQTTTTTLTTTLLPSSNSTLIPSNSTTNATATTSSTPSATSTRAALSLETGPAAAVRQAGKFAFVRVYSAGHAVGASRPDVLFALFRRAIAGTDVATGGKKVRVDYVSVGDRESSYKEGKGGLKG